MHQLTNKILDTPPPVRSLPANVARLGRSSWARRSPMAVAMILLGWLVGGVVVPAQGQDGNGDNNGDFQRWASYSKRTAGRVFRDQVQPNWVGNPSDSFWYRVKTDRDTHEFVFVDTVAKTRQPAFDHASLASALSQMTDKTVAANRIDLRSLSFGGDVGEMRFRFANEPWRFQLPAGPLSKIDLTEDADGISGPGTKGLSPQRKIVRSTSSSQRAPIQFENQTQQSLEVFWVDPQGSRVKYATIAPKQSYGTQSFIGHAWVLVDDKDEAIASFVVDPWNELAVIDADTPRPQPWKSKTGRRNRSSNLSPDERWSVSFNRYNVALEEKETGKKRPVSLDGTSSQAYRGPVWWSPDSQHFVVMKVRDVKERTIAMVDSAPGEKENASIHGVLKTITYVKPGDELDIPRPVLFSIGSDVPIEIDNRLFENPFAIRDLAWHDDGQSFSFLYNQRGHQTLRLISVDVETVTPKAVIDETSETFVCYSQKKFLQRIDSTSEVIWMSERSGWNHLYLIDQASGRVKNAITSGDWVVREVDRVDVENRQLWLKVSGIDPDQDPYHIHLVRVDFDGQNLTRLTRGDGNHRWRFSPDDRFLLDTFSRVDLPPVTQLRDAVSGELVCDLEQADVSELLKTGWAFPERFVAKGRDGVTEIHGVIVRPTDFDPQRQYPVLEDIYAGPHGAFVPKSFGLHNRMYEMAELGFIVVKIDGMGTNYRSKAFHDVCWQNLGDSGFPDRIAWMKAAAKDRPEMDLSRVGIWGGSAGGQSAMRALIAHGEFYKAASADCGCHDNRVDKIWWNEQWMGWPIGPHYAQQSNVTQAHRMQGDLLLIWGELDTNVDPASTMQVIDALIKADKPFEQLIMPGVGHGAAGHPYAKRRQADFFVRKLLRQKSQDVSSVGSADDHEPVSAE